MPASQAFTLAFGLAVAILGYQYIVWRSVYRDDRASSILRVLVVVSSVGALLWTGTLLLLMSEPHVLIRSGIGIFLYAFAFKSAFMGWRHRGRAATLVTFKTMLQIHSLANIVAACLSGIGCLIMGGPIGILGGFAALSWTLLHLWFLKSLTTE